MTFEFEKEDPKTFIKVRMRMVYDIYQDMKEEMRGFNEAELQEVKELASDYARLGSSPLRNDVVMHFAHHTIQQARYRMAVIRDKEREASDD